MDISLILPKFNLRIISLVACLISPTVLATLQAIIVLFLYIVNEHLLLYDVHTVLETKLSGIQIALTLGLASYMAFDLA